MKCHKTLLPAATGVVLMAGFALGAPARADDKPHAPEEHEKNYIFGYPASPSEEWVIAAGGRLYDNWINALNAEKPKQTHPAWPASNTRKKGATTWRCKSCHGWDFRGKDGKYATGSYRTGIKGVLGVKGMDPGRIHAILMDKTHGFTHDMIPQQHMLWLSTFLSKGTYDVSKYVAADGTVNGDPDRGRALFQNTCAACHGYSGTTLNWGSEKKPSYVGTEANANPWEVFAKIRHGHPGAYMIAYAAFSMQDAADVLKYAQTLPTK